MLKLREKDVKTPCVGFSPLYHALKGVANCRETRLGGADAFEASFFSTASAKAEHVAATADMSAKVRQGMIKLRVADGYVRNRYANNPGKLAAWLSASHVEKAPKKKTPPTP